MKYPRLWVRLWECALCSLAEVREEEPAAVVWERLAGQPCRIPNGVERSLDPGHFGVFRLAYSPDGRMLAAGCGSSAHSTDFLVLVYHIPSGAELCRLRGHGGLVYDLDWSPHQRSNLLTSSADATAM